MSEGIQGSRDERISEERKKKKKKRKKNGRRNKMLTDQSFKLIRDKGTRRKRH